MQTEDNKKNKNIRKILGNTLKTILILIILIFLAILVRALVFHKTDVFGYRIYVIMSGSMEPVINPKDAIITKETNELHVDDIIAFKSNNSITIHRIMSIKTEGSKKLYQTKEENNNKEDLHLVEQSEIKGKVVKVLSGVGNALVFLKKNLVYLLLGICIVIIISVTIVIIRRLI